MSIKLRLAKLEARIIKKDESMTDEEMATLVAEAITDGQEAVHYALTHPNGCFAPAIDIGRSVEEITLKEIFEFEDLPFAKIYGNGKEVAGLLLDIKEIREGFGY